MTTLPNVNITVLAEENGGNDLPGEHGLSLWIEAGDRRILFDTGQSNLFAENAAALGIDLSRAHAIVLSHGHYDHTGGLPAALQAAPGAPVFLYPAAVEEKYAVRGRFIGMPVAARDALAQHTTIHLVRQQTAVCENVYATGQIPRRHPLEHKSGEFFSDVAGRRPDPLRDDQALYLKTAHGVIVILGCAHSGVINTLDFIAKAAGVKQFAAVLGGMHLHNASAERLEATAEALARYCVALVVPAHCTGQPASSLFSKKFPEAFQKICVGKRFSF